MHIENSRPEVDVPEDNEPEDDVPEDDEPEVAVPKKKRCNNDYVNKKIIRGLR